MNPFEYVLIQKNIIRHDKFALLFEKEALCEFSSSKEDMDSIILNLNSAYNLGVEVGKSEYVPVSGLRSENPYSIMANTDYDAIGFETIDLYLVLPDQKTFGLSHLSVASASKFVDLMNKAHLHGKAFGMSSSKGVSTNLCP